jgi:hypothetical protein
MDEKPKTLEFSVKDMNVLYKRITDRAQSLVDFVCSNPLMTPYTKSIQKLASREIDSTVCDPMNKYSNITSLITQRMREIPQSEERDKLMRLQGEIQAYSVCLFDMLKYKGE